MDRRLIIIVYVLGAGFAIRILLAMTGVMDAVNARLPFLPAPGYLWSALVHTGYGLLLFGLVISTGTLFLRLARRLVMLDDSDVDILGFPVGLIACLVLSLAVVAGIPGQVFAALVVGWASIDFWRGRQLRPVSPHWIVILVLAMTLGVFLALLWHLPTATYTGSMDLGDLTTYIGWYHALKVSLHPFYNLGMEGDVYYSYFNNLQSMYALALDFLPGFDIYLFLSASLSTFYVVSMAWLLHALLAYRARLGYEAMSWPAILAVAGLVIAGTWYPSWILDSPPFVFMGPVLLSVVYAVARAGDHPGWLAFALGLAVLGTAIGKVVALVVASTYAGTRLLECVLRQMRPMHLFWFLAVTAVVGSYIVSMVLTHGPVFLNEWSPGPESWHRFLQKGWGEFRKVISFLLRDLGLLIIVAATLKFRNMALTAAAGLGVAANYTFPFLFTATPAAATLTIAGCLVLMRRAPGDALWMLLAGVLMMIPYLIKVDQGNIDLVVLWVLVMGPMVALTLRYPSRHDETAGGPMPRRLAWGHTVALIALVSLSLVATAQGELRLGKRIRQVVAPTLYDIWVKTRRFTPEDALIFTDQTGNENGRLSGWNDYAQTAERQFYISSWNLSPLRYEPELRARRLADNAAVLSGRLSPRDLSLSRPYSGYYAVVEAHREVPRNFVKVYANDDYGLYAVSPQTLQSAH